MNKADMVLFMRQLESLCRASGMVITAAEVEFADYNKEDWKNFCYTCNGITAYVDAAGIRHEWANISINDDITVNDLRNKHDDTTLLSSHDNLILMKEES